MADPLLLPSDLALYLKDSTIDEPRAAQIIGDAQILCENYLGITDDSEAQLTPRCAPVVARVACRAYVSITKARGATPGSPFGADTSGSGGVWLAESDKKDLRRAFGGGGAYSVNLLAGWEAPALPPWDTSSTDVTISTS